MANLNTNLTTTEGLSPTIQTYYDRKMLLNMKPKLVHVQFGQKRPVPRHRGKTVNFRKWTPFGPTAASLSEGIVPDGQDLAMTEKTAAVREEGGYVTVSNILDLTAFDPVVNDAVEMMSDQGALTIDTRAREELTSGTDATNVIYATGTSRSAIAASNKLTAVLLRKAVRSLKKAKAKMFTNGSGRPHYVAIIGPDTEYDLQDDADWKDVAKYQDKEAIYTGEIGQLYGVRVVMTTEAKLFEPKTILDAGTNIEQTLTLKTIAADAYLSATPSIQVTATATDLGSAGIAALVNKKIVVAGMTRKITAAAADATPANGTVLTLDSALTGFDNKAAALNGLTIYGDGGGKDGNPVAATLVIAKDAYGVIDIEGSGAVSTTIKPRGSAGTADPLDQISTIGWHVTAFTTRILQPAWLVRIEHGISA